MWRLLAGALIGWALSFVFGWNRRAWCEHAEFVRGYRLGCRRVRDLEGPS